MANFNLVQIKAVRRKARNSGIELPEVREVSAAQSDACRVDTEGQVGEKLPGRDAAWPLSPVRLMWRLVAMAMALLPVTAAAQESEVGRALAERWCVSCHVTDRTQGAGTASGVPTFPAIAAMPTTTEGSLRGILSQGHGRMPDFSLGRRDQDALIAYILSLH